MKGYNKDNKAAAKRAPLIGLLTRYRGLLFARSIALRNSDSMMGPNTNAITIGVMGYSYFSKK